MICIFSSAVDISTTDVMRWLHYLGRKDVIRVNYNDPEQFPIRLQLDQRTFTFYHHDKEISLSDIDAVWYRKGRHWLCDQFFPVTVQEHTKFTSYLNTKLKNEAATLSEYLHHIISGAVPVLGSASKGNLNKLLVLLAAKEVGFMIPDFFVSNHKETIAELLDERENVITKSLSDGLYFFENMELGKGYFSYTEKVDREMLLPLPAVISPSLLQCQVDKKYELRVFYLEGKCYAMAILSQQDDQTKIDFRRYNEKKPNRCLPYILPSTIETKIKALFNKLELNTGSVDLIVDKQDNYFFLEINPVGQFNMVSSPCNYFLEKKVAKQLIAYANKSRKNTTA